MTARREIGPKIVRNKSALKRYILTALLAAAAGAVLAGGIYYLIGFLSAPKGEQSTSLIYQLPGMILLVTVLTVMGILFFGFRAYFMGHKSRRSFLSSRMKIKRS